MFCARCGTKNEDGAAFCMSCGAPMTGSAPMAGGAPMNGGVQQPVYQTAQPANRPSAVEGNIGAAWRDITSSPGWVKKVFLLMLIGCVPILNFAAEGYAIRWARELSFKKRAGLPNTIFKKKEISTGFSAWLVRIALTLAYLMVAALVTLLMSGLFGIVSAPAGAIIAVVFIVAFGIFYMFFYGPAVDASVMRMAVVGYLETGFNFGVVWKAFRKSMGSLIGASIVPRLAVGFVGGIVIGLLALVMMAIIGASAYSSSRLFSSFMDYRMLTSSIAGVGFVYLFFQSLIGILMAMFNVFTTLFTSRAVGHWVARFAPEWADESDEDNAADAEEGGVEFEAANAAQ